MNFEDEIEEKSIPAAQEREISLGTSTILGIFLGLALVCAAFFGFGYSVGRRGVLAAAASVPETSTAKTDPPFSNFKPAPVARSAAAAAPSPAAASSDEPAASAAAAPDAADGKPVPPAPSDGIWMVQVSTSTVKQDAEKLTGVLVRQGFGATMKEDKDHRFRIRVGPFATKKDADTTRQMLEDDGYKAPFISNH